MWQETNLQKLQPVNSSFRFPHLGSFPDKLTTISPRSMKELELVTKATRLAMLLMKHPSSCQSHIFATKPGDKLTKVVALALLLCSLLMCQGIRSFPTEVVMEPKFNSLFGYSESPNYRNGVHCPKVASFSDHEYGKSFSACDPPFSSARGDGRVQNIFGVPLQRCTRCPQLNPSSRDCYQARGSYPESR